MIFIFGEIFLLFALLFSFLQSIVPLFGYLRNNPYALAFARPCAFGQFIFVMGAYLLLTIAFINSDFSIAYVAANSHPSLPFLYRLTALWGAHEGSILLWIVILSLWTMIFSVTQKNYSAYVLVLALLGLINFCFISFLFFTSNPFLPALYLQTGQDLNPLLQDPGFVIHPPMLYAGYVGFSVAFAITQAALIRGELDSHWARLTRRFAVAAWCFLTIGIMLGSWWAYRVLGWGGFWFWDPVENASLLPWIAGTALIHVLILAEKKGIAKAWAALLAMICFALSLLGTFLVRSGVLISAHTFANDPARGVFLLMLLAFVLTLALIIYVIRAPRISATIPLAWLSRETGLLINSALLFMAMLTILLGTLYPLIIDALHLNTISVGAPYFNKVMMPFVLIMMFFMGIVPLCRWQKQSAKKLWQRAWKKAFISLLMTSGLLCLFTDHIEIITFISVSLSCWIILGVLDDFRLLPGLFFAHSGFAILIIGIFLSSVLNQERDVRIKPGDTTRIGPYRFYFSSIEGIQGPNYRGVRADFDVMKHHRLITTLSPEKRIYTVREMIMTKVAIHPGFFRDLYLALGEPLDQNYWSVRLYYKPFIRWIWLGGIMMMLGGWLSLFKKTKQLTKL